MKSDLILIILAVTVSFVSLSQDKTQDQPPAKSAKVEYYGRFVFSQHVYGYDTNGIAMSTDISIFVCPRTESSGLFYFGFDHKEIPSANKNTSLNNYKGFRGTYVSMQTVTNTVSSSTLFSSELFQVRMLGSIEPIP